MEGEGEGEREREEGKDGGGVNGGGEVDRTRPAISFGGSFKKKKKNASNLLHAFRPLLVVIKGRHRKS